MFLQNAQKTSRQRISKEFYAERFLYMTIIVARPGWQSQ